MSKKVVKTLTFAQQRMLDSESRGKLAFNCRSLTSHAAAEGYARKTYITELEQDCFTAGWNHARLSQSRGTAS
jgi:hypothetical protein